MRTDSIQKVFAGPGRLRFRVPDLREREETATQIADQVSALHGVTAIEVRPFTGSVVCLYDPAQTDEDTVTQAMLAAAGARQVLSRDMRMAATLYGEYETGSSRLARSVAAVFKELNRDIKRGTRGELDLGTATSLFFLSASALEVVVKRKLPTPSWFNLAWWSIRTFMVSEQDAIDQAEDDVARKRETGAPRH